MKKGIFCFANVLCASLVMSFAFSLKEQTPVFADSENSVTIETDQKLVKGNTYYAYVYIDSLENIASLNVSIHYDSTVLNVDSTYNQVSCSLHDNSIKNETISYSYVFNSGGEAYKTSLFYFYYSISNEANLGSSYFDVVIDDAYDSSLNSISVKGSRKYFDIIEGQAPTQHCYFYGISSIDSKKEEEFEFSYRISTTSVASGTIEIQYDKHLFEFVSITQLSFLNGKLVDVNSSLDGAISLSFAGTAYTYYDDVLRIKFKTIVNQNVSSEIKVIPSTFYDLDLNPIVFDGYKTTVNLSYDSSYDESLGKMFLTSNYDETSNQVKTLVKLSSNSHLGAGDFTLSWDKSYLTYNANIKKLSPSFFNVNDKQALDGTLKFSIISLTDIIEANDVIEVTFDVINPHDDTSISFEIAGSGLADSLTNSIQLNFVNCAQILPGKCAYGDWSVTREPTCTESGEEKRTCSVCGHEEARAVEAMGHDWEEGWTVDVEPTCQRDGSKSIHCRRCGAIRDVTPMAKKDHQPMAPVKENGVGATCTEDGGYDEVVYCAVCHEELSREHRTTKATGHTYGDWSVTREPTCTEPGEEKRTCSVCGHEEIREIPKIDPAPLFVNCVNSISLGKDDPSALFSKISQAIEYYNLIEDKSSVSDSYQKLQLFINSYNQMMEEMNNHNSNVADSSLSIVIGAIATVNILGVALILLKKGAFKL